MRAQLDIDDKQGHKKDKEHYKARYEKKHSPPGKRFVGLAEFITHSITLFFR